MLNPTKNNMKTKNVDIIGVVVLGVLLLAEIGLFVSGCIIGITTDLGFNLFIAGFVCLALMVVLNRIFAAMVYKRQQ